MNKYNYGKQPKSQKHKYFKNNKTVDAFYRKDNMDFIKIACSQTFVSKCIVALIILILFIATVVVYFL